MSNGIITAPSSAASLRRPVITTQQPGVPGSRGLTCSWPTTLSSTTRMRRPATLLRHRAARSSRVAGTAVGATPVKHNRVCSASAGLTGDWPAV